MRPDRLIADIPSRSTAIERAYELAKSGAFVRFDGLTNRLRQEGYSEPELALAGRSLRRDLMALCRDARERS